MPPSASRRPRTRPVATVFAALGDPTRLALVDKLADGGRRSIAQLSEGEAVTRQAITKHLRVLEEARLVRSERTGRENLYVLDPTRIAAARTYIDEVAQRWDETLGRLKTFAETFP
jgi:DNA-binding transcriptional ArsR family regulator